ncbi:DUF6527 family protein [Leptospira andrefontaineae]|uniref:Ammonia monooxygenase n=1 Tax=Leptospira andrefontaineae TaxID=2484976 RepID=A0A4R9GX76_9LEPT|nr:DUF6527 family protein [Leptospira andrefontaineae]TGK36234.1 hypothetical protein EHO65_18190 [Leptospira andrefontaineae]
MKLVKHSTPHPSGGDYYMFFCPGCKIPHTVIIGINRWETSGSLETPTIRPSVRTYFPAHEDIPEETTCHLFVKEGRLEFLQDCQHSLAGKTVDMVEFPDNFDLDGWLI